MADVNNIDNKDYSPIPIPTLRILTMHAGFP